MSYRFDKNIQTGLPEIIIDGFEKGIADSAYEGIADMRNANIISTPKQASVMFANKSLTLPPSGHTSIAFSSDDATDIFTVASTTGFYNGMALTIITVSGAGSGTAGQTYYVGDITPTTFKLYDDSLLNTLLDVTTDRTGTYSVSTFGTPTDSVSAPAPLIGTPVGSTYNYTIILCSDGLVWSINPIVFSGIGGTVAINSVQFLGNLLHSTSSGSQNTGIVIWKGYLFAFMSGKIDYLSINYILSGRPSSGWVYAWKSTSAAPRGHRALAATDDAIYFCNNQTVGSILENAGSVFDPTSAPTYTYNDSALVLPSNDSATCLAQLGVTLLVGGIENFVYPWDRISPSFNYPLVVAESFIKCIVSTNSNAYIFAGKRGRIYITNGANVELFKKFPDSLSGDVEPYYVWGWGIYMKNQLYFSISATNNSSTAINNFAGIWAIDLDTQALRLSNSLSFGTYTGTVPTMCPMGNSFPTGDGIFSMWVSGATTGIDYTSATPYINFETRIDADIIPLGSFLTKNTFSNIEYKLGKPLVSGESVKLSYRTNLNESFTEIFTSATAGLISDLSPMNFESIQWLQIRAELSSTATTPSYVMLREIRFR
jgi:hypothetical protein